MRAFRNNAPRLFESGGVQARCNSIISDTFKLESLTADYPHAFIYRIHIPAAHAKQVSWRAK